MFLFVNGLVLLAAEWLRRARLRRDRRTAAAPTQVAAAAPAAPAPVPAAEAAGPGRPGAHARQAGGRELADIRAAQASDARIARLSFGDSLWVGLLQITALFAGIRTEWPRLETGNSSVTPWTTAMTNACR